MEASAEIPLRLDIAGHHIEYDANGVPYVQYRIRVMKNVLNPIFIYRRYSDFHDLHRELINKFGDAQIPSLPTKKYFGNLSATFIEKRKVWLGEYLERLTKSIQIIKIDDFLDFINPLSKKYQRLTGFEIDEINPSDIRQQFSPEALNGIFKTTLQKRPLGQLSREDTYILCRTSLGVTDNILITKLFNGLEQECSTYIHIRDLVCAFAIIYATTYAEKIDVCCNIYSQSGQLSRNDIYSMIRCIRVVYASNSSFSAEQLGEFLDIKANYKPKYLCY
eukprot:TRINITY_DN1683_c0_g3_i11.p1 TRINITY_DN1683_c0_g3~~TRINITY_DN1683_c0_g3_i11.p1  ORF type:complete len:277 (+),score=44.83 TRINITY_DN1683_c0_g3_i11:984-1814(+)